jgi:UDP-GlcNAc:undecaprenyl-phosphate GlcNAc-1-phosphate transferase
VIAPILILLAAATILSAALTLGCRTIGRRALLHDSQGSKGHIKQHIRRVPNIGGVAIFATIAALMLAGLGIAARNADPAAPCLVRENLPSIAEHMQGMRDRTPMALTLLACLLALHITGLIDDRRALPPVPKLLLIAAASAAMVIGFDCRLFSFLDAYAAGPWLSWALTVLWFIAVTNAMNFMDNMDGLAAGVAVTASAFFLAAALTHGQWFIALTLAVLIGALLGFLVFNFPWPLPNAPNGSRPGGGATIFMGDAGSLVIGFLLAFLTVRTTYIDQPQSNGTSGGWYAVFMPLCVLAVPLYDLASVCIIRISQGKSPLVGDQQHFSHRLRSRGLTVRQTLAVIYGCTAITGIAGTLLAAANAWQAILLGVQTLTVLALLGIYEHASTRSRGSSGGAA